MARIRKGDDVVVRTGRNRGKRGTVLRVLADERVLVEGVNVVKRHTRANPQRGTQGGIVQKEMPVRVSNINIFNPATNKGDRIGYKWLGDGRKVRIFKSTGEVIDV
jgi:large subunit ribosomal protein L24